MPKKGKGKEKSAQARDKYESRKLKKELAKIGEDDIETILAQIKKKDAEKVLLLSISILGVDYVPKVKKICESTPPSPAVDAKY
jgi:hypothetical protein